MADIGTLRAIITADATEFNAAVAGAARRIERFSKGVSERMKATGQAFESLGRTMSIALTAPLTLLAKNIDKTGLEFARMQKRLEFATGSSKAAGEAMQFIQGEVTRLGTDLQSSIEGFSKFAAAARGTALEGEGARNIFSGLNAAVATLGLSADQASGAITALEQIMSKGKVQAEELRGQLGERIPGAFQIAAKAMNVTTAELNEMLDRGELVADEFLPRFALELQKTFTGAAPLAVRAANRLSNEFLLLKASLVESGLDNLFSAIRLTLADLLETIRNTAPETLRLGMVIAAAAAAAGPMLVVFGKMLSIGGGVVGTIAKVAGAFATLLPILGAILGPIFAVISAVSIMWGVFGDFVNVQGMLSSAWNFIETGFTNVANFFREFAAFIMDKNTVISESTRTAIEFIAKAWLSLRIAWNTVLVGLKTVAQGMIAVVAGVLDAFENVANFFGLEIAKNINGAKKALEGWIGTLEDSKTANFEAIDAMRAQWGQAPEVLREGLQGFIATIGELPEQIRSRFESAFPGVIDTVRNMFQMIQDFIATGEIPTTIDVPVNLPNIDEIDAKLKAFGDTAKKAGKDVAKMWRSVGQTYVQVFSQLSSLFKEGTREQKAFAISSILLDTAIGIMKAFELPFPLNWAQAAAVAAMGAIQLAAVGGGGGGSGGGFNANTGDTNNTVISDATVAPTAQESVVLGSPAFEDTEEGDGGQSVSVNVGGEIMITDEQGRNLFSYLVRRNNEGGNEEGVSFVTTGG